jgi:hypothetical protein
MGDNQVCLASRRHVEKGSAMSTPVVTVERIVKPDGTVEIPEMVNLPAAKVQVTLVSLPDLPQDDPFWQRIQKNWEGQQARGHIARAVEEVESQRQTFRQEMEDEIQEAMRLQEECRRARDPASAAQGPNA